MKKLLSLIVALSACLGLAAATPQKKPYTNLLEKVPQQGSYVGYAGIELLSPSAFGQGGFNVGVTTAHGKMFTDRLFLGLGAGYIADFRNEKGLIPLFVDGRIFFHSTYQRRIYPHIGLRAGAEIATEGGCGGFAQIALGIRVPVTEKFAINIEVGPEYASKYEREHKEGAVSDNGAKFRPAGGRFAFFARVNFEF